MADKMFTVKLIKSPIGARKSQVASVRGLGLNKMGQSRQLLDTPSNRGLVNAVRHLVVVVA